MISAEQIEHRFFILGVVAAAVIPRQPSDHSGYWSVGGRLSHNFRKLLLAIAGVNMCRLFLSDDVPREHSGNYQLGSDILGVVEVTGLTFLCFLTPYVLQCGLSDFFNIRPGESLKFPLYLAVLLSFLAWGHPITCCTSQFLGSQETCQRCFGTTSDSNPSELQLLHYCTKSRPRICVCTNSFGY